MVIGAGLLGLEFIGLPILDIKCNYKKIPALRNPFAFVAEKEPFLEDELWHFVGASAFTELNYIILENYLFIHKPYLLTGLLTIAFWTGMECLDALSGSGFSLRDELGNIAGTTFSLCKLKYPDIPFKVRIGIKDIRSFNSSIQKAVNGSIHHQLGKQYDFMKVEFIFILPDSYVYTGAAVSRTGNREDLYGVTLGFDALDCINDLKDGWWNKPLGFIGRHFSTSISFTYWLN
jgi:hypothetical protein